MSSKEYMKEYRITNNQHIKKQVKEYHSIHKEHIKKQRKEYLSRPEIKEREKKYRQRPEIKKYFKEYFSRLEVKEHRKEYGKKYYEVNKGHIKEREKKYRKEYCSRPEVKEHKKEYYARPEGKEHRKEISKKYYRTPQGRKIIHTNRLFRRERINNIKHIFSFRAWERKKLKTEGICPSCNKNIGINKLTIDHIIPVSKAPKGFLYTIDDVEPLCFSCNVSKGNKLQKNQNEPI